MLHMIRRAAEKSPRERQERPSKIQEWPTRPHSAQERREEPKEPSGCRLTSTAPLCQWQKCCIMMYGMLQGFWVMFHCTFTPLGSRPYLSSQNDLIIKVSKHQSETQTSRSSAGFNDIQMPATINQSFTIRTSDFGLRTTAVYKSVA